MAVTANKVISQSVACQKAYPAAAANLYQGTLAFINAAGYADDDTGSGANRFGGIVKDQRDNSGGSAGDLTVELLTEGEFLLVGTGFAQSSVGNDAFATDNYAITAGQSAASQVRIGRITEYVSSTKVKVKIDTLSRQTGQAETKTADYTVTAADSGKAFDTTGATGAVVFALPAAVPGLEYFFRVGAAQELRIDPNGTETIALPSTGVASAAGAYLTANAAGETVHIKCIVAGTWNVFGFTGTWTAV